MSPRARPIIVHLNEPPRITDETVGRILPTGQVLPVLWPGRECGECSMCCSILAVHEDGVDTKYGETCVHARNHRGCAIYATRPGVCKTWSCLWRLGILAPEMRPDKVKAVLEVQAPPGDRCIVVHVKPKHKGIWRREGPLRNYIKQARRTMLGVIIVCGNERFLIGEPWQYQIRAEMDNPDGTVTQTVDTFGGDQMTTTRTATIRVIHIAQIKNTRQALGLNVAILLDNGYIIRTKLDTLYAWGDETKVGSSIEYDVDEHGTLSNPRPIVTYSCSVCGTLQRRDRACQVCLGQEQAPRLLGAPEYITSPLPIDT